MRHAFSTVLVGLVLLTGCAEAPKVTRNFGDDAAFLSRHEYTVTLADQRGLAQVLVVPAYQGRVMTSTAEGVNGQSFGWINRDLIRSRRAQPHINAFGGEDRFWLGPEGGQFSIFFPPLAPFTFDHWQVPSPLDTERFDIRQQSSDRVVMRKTFELTNYSGHKLSVQVDRTVQLLGDERAWRELGLPRPYAREPVRLVGYETSNTVKNVGPSAWTRQTGLLSVWILGMLNASPDATIIIPIREGDPKDLGPAVNTAYFGQIPPQRLKVQSGLVFFRADGNFRSKIGIGPRRTKGILASYDPAAQTLSVVQFMPIEPKAPYVNSLWKLQDDPFAGDAANAYNDGPLGDGKQLGPFYELESSSPGLELAPGQSKTHISRTYHIRGDSKALDPIARGLLGVGIQDILAALPKP